MKRDARRVLICVECAAREKELLQKLNRPEAWKFTRKCLPAWPHIESCQVFRRWHGYPAVKRIKAAAFLYLVGINESVYGRQNLDGKWEPRRIVQGSRSTTLRRSSAPTPGVMVLSEKDWLCRWCKDAYGGRYHNLGRFGRDHCYKCKTHKSAARCGDVAPSEPSQ